MADLAGGMAGRRIDRYVIESQLGAGGFGAVYRARHTILGTEVALKVLSPQHSTTPDMVQRFLREAQSAAAIGHPNIIAVQDAGVSSEGLPFLAMEVLAGEDLEARVARRAPLPIGEALDLALQILAGLGAAHARGIAHRDMKPANVFLASGEGGRTIAKLLDFGISKVVDPSRISTLTRTGVMLGTPAYMAPEQLEDTRSVDHRADLYAVAVIVFEMLTRRLPYPADTFGDLMARVQGLVPERLDEHLPHAPPELTDILAVGMAQQAAQRFQTADELARALRSVLPDKGQFPSTRPYPHGPSTGPFGGASQAWASHPPASQPPASHPPASHPPSQVGWSHSVTPQPWSAPSGPPSHVYGAGSAPPLAHYPSPSYPAYPPASSVPSVPRLPPAAQTSGAVWLALGAFALLLPLACVGGGFIAMRSIDEPAPVPRDRAPDPPPPIATPRPPVVGGGSSAPAEPIPIPTPVPVPSPVPPVDGPLVAAAIPAGAEPCAVPLVHDSTCDRQWETHLPEQCQLSGGRELHVVGAYSPLDEGTAVIRLDIARTVAPIVLVLNSYSEVTWDIRLAEGVRIERVHMSGYARSRVTGLPGSVRVDWHARGWPIMGWSWEGMTADWSGQRLTDVAQRETRLPLRAYLGCYSPSRFFIGQSAP